MKYMRILTLTRMHIHTYIHTYIYVCLWWKVHNVFTLDILKNTFSCYLIYHIYIYIYIYIFACNLRYIFLLYIPLKFYHTSYTLLIKSRKKKVIKRFWELLFHIYIYIYCKRFQVPIKNLRDVDKKLGVVVGSLL